MRPKPLSKEKIEEAMRHTQSNRAAARYLGVSYQHFKPYAKLFSDKDGINLFEKHKNQCGRGIPKHLKSKEYPALQQIFDGVLDPVHFTPAKIRNQLIHENYLPEECNICGFKERRILDYRIPLLLSFKDNNKKNYKLDNLELVCYNCYFMYIGTVYTEEQIEIIEDAPRDKFKVEKPEFQLDQEHLDNMAALGIL